MKDNAKIRWEGGKRGTSVWKDANGYTNVRYHSTDVVSFNEKEIILRTGGWYSMTTKTRMNQASDQFNLSFGVYQQRGDWYINMFGYTIDFHDDISLPRTKSEFENKFLAKPYNPK